MNDNVEGLKRDVGAWIEEQLIAQGRYDSFTAEDRTNSFNALVEGCMSVTGEGGGVTFP